MSLITDGNSVRVSGIFQRIDNLNNKANEVNNRLVAKCGNSDILFLSHSESIISSKYLSESKSN